MKPSPIFAYHNVIHGHGFDLVEREANIIFQDQEIKERASHP